jgi:hypothetical protein
MLHWFESVSWRVWIIAGAGLAVLLVALALLVWRRLTAMERRTRHLLASIADRVLRDAAIPDGVGGWVVIDAIMLRDRCFYVLDLRDVEGAVFGADKMDNWTVIGRRWRSQFQNPLRLMQDRVIAVRTLVPELSVTGHVLFSSRAQFPKGRPEGVQLMDEFSRPLARSRPKKPVELDAQTEQLWQRLCNAAEIVTRTQRRRADAQTASARS